MFHLFMLLTGWLSAIGIRQIQAPSTQWHDRWNQAIVTFVLPPLLLISTAVALLWMGPIGHMVHGWLGWTTYAWAIGWLGIVGFLGLQLLAEAGRSMQQIRQYEAITVQNHPARKLETAMPFVAQIGFWQPQTVISRGLLETLDEAHLQAVLAHEAAHQHYRDTFWFFWLGWLRRCSRWLPQTEVLWQELLLLREMRADRFAAQTVDPLLLAEALYTVVSTPMQPEFVVAFNGEVAVDRLNERIDALLEVQTELEILDRLQWRSFLVSAIVFLPLLAIPFH
jgi:Zn-dependent protease with chaperone function